VSCDAFSIDPGILMPFSMMKKFVKICCDSTKLSLGHTSKHKSKQSKHYNYRRTLQARHMYPLVFGVRFFFIFFIFKFIVIRIRWCAGRRCLPAGYRACTFGTSGMFFGHEIKISVE
jgi:hypothetical protein